MQDADEIDVRALREPCRVAADRPAPAADVRRVEVPDEFDVVGNARVEEPPPVAAADLRDLRHAQFDQAARPLRAEDAGRVQPVRGGEAFAFAADAQVLGEKGEAAGSVAAHFAFRTVGVEVTHRAVGPGAAGERHHSVGADAEVAVAEVGDQPRIGRESFAAVVYEDEVVACAFVFGKFRSHVREKVMLRQK